MPNDECSILSGGRTRRCPIRSQVGSWESRKGLSAMRRISAVMTVVGLAAVGVVCAGQCRLEIDFSRQQAKLASYEGATDEESCGGTWLKVYQAGGETRKMEWDVETSTRLIRREFYLSRGKPQLVIETSHLKWDSSGERLKTPRHEYTRRYWRDDRTAGAKGIQVRRELRGHAASLVKEFRTNRAKFAKTAE